MAIVKQNQTVESIHFDQDESGDIISVKVVGQYDLYDNVKKEVITTQRAVTDIYDDMTPGDRGILNGLVKSIYSKGKAKF